MLKKDYIQRYLDELTKMIAKVLQLKLNNEPNKANEVIDEFGNSYLNLNINELVNKENLIEFLVTERSFEITHFKILEELLYQKYLLTSTNASLKKCTLEVLNYVSKSDKDFSFERQNRISELSN